MTGLCPSPCFDLLDYIQAFSLGKVVWEGGEGLGGALGGLGALDFLIYRLSFHQGRQHPGLCPSGRPRRGPQLWNSPLELDLEHGFI